MSRLTRSVLVLLALLDFTINAQDIPVHICQIVLFDLKRDDNVNRP